MIESKRHIPKYLIRYQNVANLPILHVNTTEQGRSMGSKVFVVLNEVYKIYKNKVDWFFMIDDDGYVFVDNFLKFISSKISSDPKLYGFRFIHTIPEAPDGHIGGGSGKVNIV